MSLPKHLQPKSTKKQANANEKRFYKHLCSGALDFKGDFSSDTTLIEHKCPTKAKSIRISIYMLKKLFDESIEMNKEHAVLAIELGDFYFVGKVVRK